MFSGVRYCLEEVCSLLKSREELKNISVSINMPMEQLLEKGFVPRFTGIVDQAGLEHRRICIEFTERAILETFEKTLDIMEQMRQDGFQFYLDDFGSGYSNFSCLLRLPFQVIKLDSCMVRPDINDAKDYSTVETLTRLFHEMHLKVVAEGAETEEDVKTLTAQGVDRIQGYALARPMPVEALCRFYEAHSETVV